MTWTITGNASDVLISISTYGNPIIHGKSAFIPLIHDDWVDSEYAAIRETLQRLKMVNADWRILSTNAVQYEIIDNADLLWAMKANAGKPIAQVTCFDRMGDPEPSLAFNIALQPQMFQQVYELFSKILIGVGEYQYSISTQFLTFRSSGADADILTEAPDAFPTLDEFRSGHPYFSDEVFFSVRQASKKNP